MKEIKDQEKSVAYVTSISYVSTKDMNTAIWLDKEQLKYLKKIYKKLKLDFPFVYTVDSSGLQYISKENMCSYDYFKAKEYIKYKDNERNNQWHH